MRTKAFVEKKRGGRGLHPPESCAGDRVWVAASHLCRGYIALLCEAPDILV